MKLYIGSKRWYNDNYQIDRNFEIIKANLMMCIAFYLAFFISHFLFGWKGFTGWIIFSIISGIGIYGRCMYKIKKLKKTHLQEEKDEKT